jgi:hypothetical protein
MSRKYPRSVVITVGVPEDFDAAEDRYEVQLAAQEWVDANYPEDEDEAERTGSGS